MHICFLVSNSPTRNDLDPVPVPIRIEYETNISHLPIAEPFLIGTPGFWRVQFTPGLQVEHSIYGTRLCFKNMFTPKVQDKSNTYYPNTTQKKGKDIEN